MGYEIYKKEKTMCYDTGGNKILVCQVGDLKPGDQYRTPGGRTILVTDAEPAYDMFTMVVDLSTGHSSGVLNDTKLGRDRAGRMYASRYLNPVQPTTVDQVDPDPDDAKNQADKNWPL